jgi:hypothetical protein
MTTDSEVSAWTRSLGVRDEARLARRLHDVIRTADQAVRMIGELTRISNPAEAARACVKLQVWLEGELSPRALDAAALLEKATDEIGGRLDRKSSE